MADIDIERKGGTNWLWPILGLLLLGLLIWGALEMMDDDDEVAVAPAVSTAVVEPAPPVVAAAPVAPVTGSPTIADVLANPSAYDGQPFSTQQVRVAEVVSDRGFWIENNGQRMLVVKNESPQPGVADVEGPADTRAARNINAGDMVQINGTLMTAAEGTKGPLDDQTRQLIQGQPIFLQANVADIQSM